MNPLDTLMWRCQSEPLLRAPLTILLLLDRVPDWDQVKSDHARAARVVPRLRQRPTSPSLLGGNCGWEEDPEFDIGRHMRRLRLPGAGGQAELLELTRHVTAAPFDDRRPLWESILVEGLTGEDDRQAAAWILRIHHCVADGRAISFWLTRFLSRTCPPQPSRAEPGPPPAQRHRHLAVLTEAPVIPPPAQPEAGGLLSGRMLRRSALGAARTARRPLDTALDTARTLRTVGGMAPLPVCKPSPLLRRRGTERRLGMMNLPIDRLRAAARAAGCAPSDAYLAALLGGLRLYHTEHGASTGDLPLAVPLPLPHRPGAPGGNRIAGLRLAGPLNEPDPRRRMAAVRDRTARARDAFTPGGLDLLLTLLNRLPTPVVTDLVGRLGRSHDLQASQVSGFQRPVRLADAAVTDAHCFGPAPGCAVMAILVVHRNRGSLGVTLDTAAVTDPAGFMQALEEGFREVLATAPQ
ncbi:wax ester/triacylglycerol synthase domain-containing protein [Actinomadura macrotermitis]|nr:wax ester/triacylglycerol synthase domain-containing protein [Actinomadura macrotermitis]